jgi:hypothetical protein
MSGLLRRDTVDVPFEHWSHRRRESGRLSVMADSPTLALGGVVLGAVLTQLGNTAWYLKKKSDDKNAAVKKAEDDLDADMRARIKNQHDACASAKKWVRDLRYWRLDDDGQRAYEIKSEASARKQECYVAWDLAKGGKQPPSAVISAIDELYAAEEGVLVEVQSGETLTPSVDELQDALERFRATVKRELGMQL